MPPGGDRDDNLMQAVAAGNEAAFAELMRRHRQWVYHQVRAIVQDSSQAEDLTQEAFTRVYRSAGDYTAQGSFTAWLRRIALNLARNHLKQRQRSACLSLSDLEMELLGTNGSEPMQALLARGLSEDVRTAIQALPDEQRFPLIMRYFGDMSLQEIAWAMRCPEGTVKSRLFHALRRVRETLTSEGESEND